MGDNTGRSTRRSALIRLAAVAGFCFPLLLLLGLHAPARENQSARPADRKRQPLLKGSVLFHRNDCRVCHSYGARGGKKGPSLVDDKWLHCDGSVTGIKKVMVHGIEFEQVKNKEKARSASMPTAKEMNLTDADVEAIARYLYGIARLD